VDSYSVLVPHNIINKKTQDFGPTVASSELFSSSPRGVNGDVVATNLGGVCGFPNGDRYNDVSDQSEQVWYSLTIDDLRNHNRKEDNEKYVFF
jgi:hypothetical protein